MPCKVLQRAAEFSHKKSSHEGHCLASSSRFVFKNVDLPPGLALRTGAAFPSAIRGESGSLFLFLAGKKFPLPASVPLEPGQRVRVEVARTQPEVVLHITPRPRKQDGFQKTPDPLTEFLPRLLQQLGGTLPSTTGRTPTELASRALAVHELLSLLLSRRGVGPSLDVVTSILRQAQAAGLSLAAGTSELAKLLSELRMLSGRSLPALLQKLAADARASTEARVARSLRSGDRHGLAVHLKEDLKSQLFRLLGDRTLTEFAESVGKRGAFESAVKALVSRLAARDLQNLRAMEHPYLFFEVPFGPRAPLVHFFGERRGRDRDADFRNASVVLDLSTSELGDIWVTLESHGSYCRCRFRAERPETLAVIEEASPSLSSALKAAGYEDAIVETSEWRGDRLSETARWMRTFSGIDQRT